MNLPILQSMLSLNRNTINDLHVAAQCAKWTEKDYRSYGMEHCADEMFAEYSKATRKIAKLVKIQKHLKKEIAETIECERFLRHHDISAIAYGQYDNSQL